MPAPSAMVEVVEGEVTRSSVFLRDMAWSKLPIAVAHGEGRFSFTAPEHRQSLEPEWLVGLRYVDGQGKPTEVYPPIRTAVPEALLACRPQTVGSWL